MFQNLRENNFYKVFRLVFVIFSLFLLGDAFYRWDGFSYYASLSDFLPSVALITILWSIVALLASACVWILFSMIEWLCLRIGLNIKTEHMLLFSAVFTLLGASTLIIKRHFVLYGTSTLTKQLVFLSVAIISILLTWSCRNKVVRWFSLIQERISPLVWLFGVCIVISIPSVIYHAWIKPSDNVLQEKLTRSYSSDMRRPNILLVTFDALAARDMSVYGYQRDTTPFIDEWAKSASLITRAEAESNITSATTASIMTGKRVWTHQTYHIPDYSKPVKIDVENLALVLKNHGYFNIAILSNEPAHAGIVSKHFDIYPNWREFFDTPQTLTEVIEPLLFKLFGKGIILYDWFVKEDFVVYNLFKRFPLDSSSPVSSQSNLAFRKFIDIIDNEVSTPYFAWIHLYPPHHDYLPPEHYKGMFDSSSELRTFSSQLKLHDSLPNKRFTDEMQPIINILRARYDEFIRYCDDQFKEFIGKLEAKNKLKDTIVILSSDHGESFEHNTTRHQGPYLFESMTHIPMIIKEPGQTQGRIINELVEQIDIPATILDLTNIPVPSWMEGRSIVPLLRDDKLPLKPIFSMNLEKNRGLWYEITKGTIAVWDGDYKLVHYLEENKSQLFNLKKDPDELMNLFEKEPDVGRHLLSLIYDNLNMANDRISR